MTPESNLPIGPSYLPNSSEENINPVETTQHKSTLLETNDIPDSIRPHALESLDVQDHFKNRVVEILDAIKDVVLATIQMIYRSFSDNLTLMPLMQQEQLSAEHLDIYLKQFNADNKNHAYFLKSYKATIYDFGPDWTKPKEVGGKSRFDQLLSLFKEDNPEMWEGKNSLREVLITNDKSKSKPILAMVMNRKAFIGNHWTVVHFDFNNNTISYVDSARSTKDADIINARLEQAKKWIQTQDNNNNWSIEKPPDEDASHPSVLSKQKQWDFWECGIFAIHFTHLVANKGKKYDAIDKMESPEIYRGVAHRRLKVMEAVKHHIASTKPINSTHK